MAYAVITGSTSGIGKAIAEKFLSEGFSVAVCARTKNDLDEVEAEWGNRYPDAKILSMPVDLSVMEEVKKFAEAVLEKLPHVDVLVNNAGGFFPGKLADEEEGHLEELMKINLYSAYHLVRAFLTSMKQRRSGHIFNISSIAGLKAYENGGSYSITKYALQGFSENLRHELKGDGIKVTAIIPGATWTKSWQASGLPEERFMKVDDIADMVWATYSLSKNAVVETIVMRPQLGDI